MSGGASSSRVSWQTSDSLSTRLDNVDTNHCPLDQVGMERTLIIGAGSGGRILARELKANPQWGFLPIGFVDDDPGKVNRMFDGLPVLGNTASLPEFAHVKRADVVVVAVPSAEPSVSSRLIAIAELSAARVLSMPAIGSILTGTTSVTTLRTVRPVDVLGRPVVKHDRESCYRFVSGERVLITGAAGSIGSELSMQIAGLDPEHLILLDTNETGLHDLTLDIRRSIPSANVSSTIVSVTDRGRIGRVFAEYRPGVVVHAAAYKHVPAMEQQPDQALETNVIGSDIIARHAAAYGAKRFILVSTDKAVRPTSVMGATKRLAELAVDAVGRETGLSVCSVRFGNVLGSRGSVIPTFERQIRDGGPVTVTDARMRRYFMTIPEAVSLIIQAGAFHHSNVTYMLDMGEDVSILDLAKRVIQMHGLRVGKDIDIVFTGMRPGEKLYEELSLQFENANPTEHPKIRRLDGHASLIASKDVLVRLSNLWQCALQGDQYLAPKIHELIAELDGESPALDRHSDGFKGEAVVHPVRPKMSASVVSIPLPPRKGARDHVSAGTDSTVDN